jgi:hypothetical protein
MFSSQPRLTALHSSRLRPHVIALAAVFAAVAVSAWAGPIAPAFIYGIDNNNDIYEVDPLGKSSVLVLSQAAAGGNSNSLAYDTAREDLFFIGPDLKLKYWTTASGTTVSDVGASPIVSDNNANNAAYFNNAYWFFDFNSNVLNKISLAYSGTGVDAIPSISGSAAYSIAGMDLPDPGPGLNTNTFGDIAIKVDTGILYASTTRGRFYSVDLNGDPTNTFLQLAPAIATSGTDNTLGLQLSFNSDYSVLYGHSYENGAWYEVALSDGTRTSIDFSTTPFDGKGFRDLGGAAVVPEPSSLVLACVGGVGGIAWSLFRRRRTAA